MSNKPRSRSPNNPSITRQQEKFVDEYLLCFNATKAARKAGYKDNDLLHTNAFKLLQNTAIKEQIDARLKEAKLSVAAILKLLGDHATGSLGDFLDDNGNIDLETARETGLLHLLREIEITEIESKDGSTMRRKIKLHDPQKALELIGRHHAMFTDKVHNTEKKIIQVTIKKEE